MTITLDALQALIYGEFTTIWGKTTPFCFDNENFAETSKVAWARLTVRNTASAQDSLGQAGNRKFRRHGSVFVQVFEPNNVGMKAGRNHADIARNMFEGRNINGVVFDSATVREIGPDGKWYQTLIETPFAYDDVK